MGLLSGDGPNCLNEPITLHGHTFAARSLSYTAPTLHNWLPVEMKLLTSVDSFKKHLKAVLFSQTYNSADGIIEVIVLNFLNLELS